MPEGEGGSGPSVAVAVVVGVATLVLLLTTLLALYMLLRNPQQPPPQDRYMPRDLCKVLMVIKLQAYNCLTIYLPHPVQNVSIHPGYRL